MEGEGEEDTKYTRQLCKINKNVNDPHNTNQKSNANVNLNDAFKKVALQANQSISVIVKLLYL